MLSFFIYRTPWTTWNEGRSRAHRCGYPRWVRYPRWERTWWSPWFTWNEGRTRTARTPRIPWHEGREGMSQNSIIKKILKHKVIEYSAMSDFGVFFHLPRVSQDQQDGMVFQEMTDSQEWKVCIILLFTPPLLKIQCKIYCESFEEKKTIKQCIKKNFFLQYWRIFVFSIIIPAFVILT